MAKQKSQKPVRSSSADERKRRTSQIILAVISIMLIAIWIITLLYR